MSYYHEDHDRQYDHQARVREVLARKVARLPYEVVIQLQEVAAALEFGEPLDLVVTRLRLAPSNLDRGGVQVQPREGIDFDQIAADKSKTKRMTDGPRA
jgi:hypothetical protein